MQHPCDAPSWSSVVDRAKLVYAVGWYNAQHNVANVSAKDHLIGSSPSFCQAVNLSQQPVRSKSCITSVVHTAHHYNPFASALILLLYWPVANQC
jgi:hypothetical protein